MTVFEGNSLGPPRRLEGWGHAVIRPRLDVVTLLSRLVCRGLTQHFAIVQGSVTSVLRKWCALMGVEFCYEELTDVFITRFALWWEWLANVELRIL